MYNKFFGFKEKPFKLVPNPAYLFLSKSHEEALAYLNYAISQGDGFVKIIGEVGTGKTTLCRAFLESLNHSTEAAYIFNPKLGPKQLLKSIQDEFGLGSESDTIKDLIDDLNAFLMLKKGEGKKVVLLIDEAQNLSKHVLEQLRLLSNLETNQDKLLQIILVGQPELAEMLNTHELRQIGQRITLSYNLLPLSAKETKGYIEYRIGKAAQKQVVKFDVSALRQIYKFSGGIPRLINIVCDRSLLTAFVLNQTKITAAVARTAIQELASSGSAVSFGKITSKKALSLLFALGVILLGVIFSQLMVFKRNPFSSHPKTIYPIRTPIPPPVVSQAPSANDAGVKRATPPLQVTPSPVSVSHKIPSIKLADYLKQLNARGSRAAALKHALGLWDTPLEIKPYLSRIKDDKAFFDLCAKLSGFQILYFESDIRLLRNLDLPALLQFYPAKGALPGYLALHGLAENGVVFSDGEDYHSIHAGWDELKLHWSGVAYIPWKNFLPIQGTIPTRTSTDSIATLKLFLHNLGFENVIPNNDYDASTRALVKKIQAKYDIPADGVVGSLTKIILYRENETFQMPKLTEK
ncbi:MAG: AAA family ATPase [Deltaproteobacteria bacterium]|nr:AAA family ATPase [Deltaproteobacteria bacterium]